MMCKSLPDERRLEEKRDGTIAHVPPSMSIWNGTYSRRQVIRGLSLK